MDKGAGTDPFILQTMALPPGYLSSSQAGDPGFKLKVDRDQYLWLPRHLLTTTNKHAPL
jgi:hypothetical protein